MPAPSESTSDEADGATSARNSRIDATLAKVRSSISEAAAADLSEAAVASVVPRVVSNRDMRGGEAAARCGAAAGWSTSRRNRSLAGKSRDVGQESSPPPPGRRARAQVRGEGEGEGGQGSK